MSDCRFGHDGDSTFGSTQAQAQAQAQTGGGQYESMTQMAVCSGREAIVMPFAQLR